MFEVCRGCGCTNFSACPGGCWWVEDDLCSTCAIAVDVETGDSLTADELVGAWTPNAAGIVLPAVDDRPPVDDPDPDLAYTQSGRVVGRVVGWIGGMPVVDEGLA